MPEASPTETSSPEENSDIYADIRTHVGGTKYMQENIVIAAIDETLEGQGLTKSSVAYMGAFLLSLKSGSAEPPVIGAILVLLERALGRVPRTLLSAKGSKMAQVLASVANAHPDHPVVLRPALSCANQLLVGMSTPGAEPGPETSRLFLWILEFVQHSNPKVRCPHHRPPLSLEPRPTLSPTDVRVGALRCGIAASSCA